MAPPTHSIPTRFLGARLQPALKLTQTGFLWSARDGETYSLNGSGACLFTALQRGVAPAELWQQLVARFAVPPPLAQRDAQLFLAQLFDMGLLELPREPAPPDEERSKP
jgi:hypothetical protein